MICRFLKIREFIFSNSDKFPEIMVSDSKWHLIIQLKELLEICNHFTVKIQAIEYPFSHFLYDYKKMLLNLEKLNNYHSITLKENIIRRMKNLVDSHLLKTAVFLDIRLKGIQNIEEERLAEETILFFFNKYLKDEKRIVEENEIHILSNEEDSDEILLSSFLDDGSNTNWKNKTILDEIGEFKRLERIPFKRDIFAFWESQKTNLPLLTEIAFLFLSIPSNQASVERSFSDLSFIYYKYRSKLNEKTTEDILFLRLLNRFKTD